MKTGTRLSSMASTLAMVATITVSSNSLPVHSCGLEPSVNGGFTISYPGALDVAVAVANARRAGLLPPANGAALPGSERLQQMLADLRKLQSRLNAGRGEIVADRLTRFSLVLVGPGLWSNYYLTPEGVGAEYHTHGPLAGESVVMTHHVVLRALLDGSLTVGQVAELGLIAYSGSDAGSAREALEVGFRSNS